MNRNHAGFTVIELLVTVTVVAVLLAIGVPSFVASINKARLVGATHNVASDLRLAHIEATKRHRQIFVTFQGSGTSTWCYGLSEVDECDCNNPALDDSTYNPCRVSGIQKVTTSADFKNITLTRSADFSISPLRGTVNAGQVTLTLSDGRITRVKVSNMGRVRPCSAAASIPDFPSDDCS
jgi:type IV fimbrial biogenesis protein FimT